MFYEKLLLKYKVCRSLLIIVFPLLIIPYLFVFKNIIIVHLAIYKFK